ncbi:hypothetical protein AB0N20_27455 [Streptomyces griseoincarnatus]
MTPNPIPPPRRITRNELEHALHVDNLRRRTAAGEGGAALALAAHLPWPDVAALLPRPAHQEAARHEP